MFAQHIYRAQRIDNGEWIKGFYVPEYCSHSYGKVAAILITDEKCAPEQTICIPVAPETACMFTGLYDGTTFDELTEDEQLEFLENYQKEDWHGRALFVGDVVTNEWCFSKSIAVIRFGKYRDLGMGDEYPQGHLGFYLDYFSPAEQTRFRKDILYYAGKCKKVGDAFYIASIAKGV